MAEVASAYVSLMASARGMGRDIERQAGGEVGKAGKNLGRGFSKAFGAVAAIGAAVGIGAFVKESIESLQRIERINTQTATVIESTGAAAGVTAQHVEDLAGSLENMTATEAESIQEGANFLLTFKNIRNEAGKGNDVFDQTVRAMTDLSRATGTDMKGASLQLGKALNDPIKGISALSRVGITFTDQQKETIQSLVEGGKTMDAQKIILAELESQFGGSAEAYAKTTEGQVELAKHAIGTLGETVTAGLLPILGRVAGFAANVLNTAAEGWPAFSERLGRIFTPARDVIVGAFGQVRTAIDGARPGISAAVETLAGVGGRLREIATSEGAQRALAVVMETVRQVAGSLASAFTTLWPTVQRVGGTVRDLLIEMKPAIITAFAVAFAGINVAVRLAAKVIAALAKAIARTVEWFYDWQNVILPVAAGIGAMVAAYTAYRLVLVATMAVQRAFLAIMAAWRTAVIGVTLVTWALNGALLANPIGAVVLLIAGLVAAFVVAWKKSETFRNIVIGTWEAMKSAGIAVFNGIKSAIEFVMNAIGAIFRAQLNIIKTVWTTVFLAVKAAVELYLNAVKTYISTVIGAIKGIFNGIRSIVGTVVGFFVSIKDGIVGNWNTLIGFVTGLPGRITSAASGMWDGIKESFRSAINAIIGWWNDLSFTIPAISILGKEVTPSFTIGTPNIPYLAKGGIVSSPTLAMIGEAGPEAVVPLPKMSEFAAQFGANGGNAPAEFDYDKLAEAMSRRPNYLSINDANAYALQMAQDRAVQNLAPA